MAKPRKKAPRRSRAAQPEPGIHLIVAEDAEVKVERYPEDWLAMLVFWSLAFIVFLQFFTRYVLNNSFAWTEEIATYCLVAIVFIGAAMCVRLGRHIHVDFLFRYLPPGAARAVATGVDVVRTLFFAYAAWLVWTFMSLIEGETMTTINLPKNLVYGAVCLGFVLMFVRSVQVSIENWRRGYSILERPEHFDAAPV
jgi:TRAP-type C4-dicarboxylate transport system permease small subunit